MKLIALTGLPRSGKDTAAAYLYEEYGYARFRFSEPLKAAAAILLNRDIGEMHGTNGFDREAVLPEWGFSTRDFLQRFGTEAMRENFGADFWVRHMMNRLDAVDRAVITDCRFENEAAMVRSLDGIVVQIYRPGTKGSAHASDAGVVSDRTIMNTGTVADLCVNLEMVLNDKL